MKFLSTGAEATVYLADGHVHKHRKVKSYRHPELDRKLRYERMHREANLLEKLTQRDFPVPKIIARDEENATLTLERIPGKLLCDVLEQNWRTYAAVLGKRIAELHAANIIHGDLTTSNMIVRQAKEKRAELVFIDFGLSFISQKVEDKAVDLHLLREALESKHYRVATQCYRKILAAYRKAYPKSREVFSRLAQVEQRGRYKGKEK